MIGLTTPNAAFRFFARQRAENDWVVLDQERDGAIVFQCDDASVAELTAALMNGDLTVLESASGETLARCRNAIGGVLGAPGGTGGSILRARPSGRSRRGRPAAIHLRERASSISLVRQASRRRSHDTIARRPVVSQRRFGTPRIVADVERPGGL